MAAILLVEDHPIIRLGVRHLLAAEPDLVVCAEAGAAGEAMVAAARSRPDVAVVELALALSNGLELMRRLREDVPRARVVVLSRHDEPLFAQRLLRAGARGYVVKRDTAAHLVTAVRRVLGGGLYVSAGVEEELLAARAVARPDSQRRAVEALSNRELEVFEAIGRGFGTAEIAAQLGVSVKTVETYRAHVKAKLKLRHGNDLVRCATTWVVTL